MKLLVKILLSLTSVAVVASLIWWSLPWLLIVVASQQLQVRGFTDIQFGKLNIAVTRTELASLHLKANGTQIDADNIRMDYDWRRLMSTGIDQIRVQELDISASRGNESTATTAVDVTWLAGLLTTPWYSYLPANRVELPSVTIRDESKQQTTRGSLSLVRDAGMLHANVKLRRDEGKPYSLDLRLYENGRLLAGLTGESDSEPRPLSIMAMPGSQGGTITAGYTADLVALKKILPLLPASLEGVLQGTLKLTEQNKASPDKTGFSIDAHLAGGALHDYAARDIGLKATGKIEWEDGKVSLGFEQGAKANVDAATLAGLSVKQVSVTLPSSIVISGNGIQGSRDAALDMKRLRQGHLLIHRATLSEMDFTINTGSDADQPVAEARFILNVPKLRYNDVSMTASPITAALTIPADSGIHARLHARLPSVTVDTPETNFAVENCDSNLRLDGERLMADANCRLQLPSTTVKASLEYNLEKDRGQVDFKTGQVSPTTESPLFISLVKGWTEPYDLVSGNITVSGRYHWNAGGEGLKTDIDVRNGSGFYESFLFSGLDYQGSVELLPRVVSSKPAKLTIAKTDIGVPISDTSATLELRAPDEAPLPVVVIRQLRMHLLGGMVKGKTLLYDLNRDSNKLVLDISGLDLAQMIELQQVDGLQATGTLDGRLPIVIENNGLLVNDAELHARPPGGRIQYVPKGGSASMQNAAPGADLVFKILEDLEYNSMVAKANYSPDGTLLIRLSIKGHSPKLETTRPVHINLNLEQNVLELLKSLSVGSNIDELLDKNVQGLFQ